jgi:predicted esterase
MIALLAALGPRATAGEGEEAAPEDDIKTEDLRAGKDEKKRFLLHGPKKDAKTPADGWRIAVVMPGGPGGAEFQGFVRNILRQALSDEYVVIQPVAVKWTEAQEIVWPTKTNPAAEMKFTTEEFVEAAIADVKKKMKVDPRHVYTLSWSSSGPAAYAISLQEKTAVTGSYVAMSVFFPNKLPALSKGKGRPYFIDHSPQDDVCLFKFAGEARDALKKAGGVVELSTYEGGHGWHGDVFGRIRKGFAFLEKNHAKPAGR